MSLIKLKSKLLEDKIKEATGLKKEQFEKVLRNRQLDTLIIFHADVGCNQNCLHCFAQPENNADLELIEKNMLQAKELGYRVGLYATEPTIEPRLLHLYKKTDEPIIITNGIDTASMLGEFEKIGIQALGISLHGPDPETHALLTGRPEKFENIVDTVKKAKDRFYIQIKMVIHRENMDKLEEQLQFVKTLGANELQIINLIKVGEAATNLAESLFLKTSDTFTISFSISTCFSKNSTSSSMRFTRAFIFGFV
ncbi:MAG: radical SAM protein [Promethearchaeota archaeon]